MEIRDLDHSPFPLRLLNSSFILQMVKSIQEGFNYSIINSLNLSLPKDIRLTFAITI